VATEAWTLDGVALMGGNFDILELNVDPPKARPDWITAADSEGDALMRQPLHENRTITMRLRVTQQASMNAALDQVGVILDKFRSASATPDGIALVWTPANSTRAVTFDVLAGEIPELPIGLEDESWSWFKQRPVFTLSMTAKPYWRGTEVLTSTASSGTAPFVALDVPSVPGDVPALGRLIVTDTATQSRRHVEWGVENQYYVSGSSPSPLIESDNMVTSGFAGAQITLSGAYDPNADANDAVRATLFSFPVQVAGTGNLGHVGTFRVKCRVYPTLASGDDASVVKVRLSWQEADGPFHANPWVSPVAVSRFCEVDLGMITIPPAKSGTQRWSGRIEAYTTSGATTDTLAVDYLLLIPAAEGYGRAKVPLLFEQPAALNAFDPFGFSGALAARVAPLGGTWAGAGDADDFAGAGTTGYLSVDRTAVSDADLNTGRYAILGSTNYTAAWAQVDASIDVGPYTGKLGVILRYTDTNNWLMATMDPVAASFLNVRKRVAGTVTSLGTKSNVPIAGFPIFYTLRLQVDTGGLWALWFWRTYDGTPGDPVLVGQDSALATGGALQTGKPGIYDANTTATAVQRRYDSFLSASLATADAALFSGRSIQFRYDGTIRQDSTGTYYGQPSAYRGSRFLVPPGTSRLVAKARRTDIDSMFDEPITDTTQIQVGYTPRGLAVPR